VEGFYIKEIRGKPVCLHALSAMLTLLSPFLKGVPARELGIGPGDDVGHLQCPDLGRLYTCRGIAIFEVTRVKLEMEEYVEDRRPRVAARFLSSEG